jgi:hypothetical protein
MRRSCLFLAICLLGCGNDNNNNNQTQLTPSVSAVQPSTVYLGRTLDVHLSGFDTMWTDTTQLSLGDGITVNKVTAASPTGLTANITIDPHAAVGMRDLTVMDGSSNELFKSTFDVEPPVKVTIQGTLAQGALAVLHVDLQDKDNFFDSTNVPGFLGPPTFTNVDITAPAGVTFGVTSVTPTTVDATIFVDVDAAPTTVDFDLKSGPPMGGTIVHHVIPMGLTVAARTAMPLNAGSNTGMAMGPYDSVLYTFSPAAGGHITSLKVTGGGQSSAPGFILLPKSGHISDAIDGTILTDKQLVTTTTDAYYAIFWDNTGDSGYQFAITRADSAVTIVSEAANNDTAPTAQAVTLPGLVQNATLVPDPDVDVYSFTVAAGDVGKKMHVTTFAGDDGAGQAVEVFGPTNLNTSLNMPAGPVDNGGFVDFLSKPMPSAGTYFVKVTNSTVDSGFGPPDPSLRYDLWLRLE